MFYFILVYILSATHTVVSKSGSHSLWVFATFLTGDSSVPFPEFTAVVMLDDIVIGRYNADERSFVPVTVQESVNVTEQTTISTVFKGIHEGMKTKAYYLIDYLNYTRGLHVQQRMIGCELLRDEPGRMMTLEAFNGESGFERRYNIQGDQHTDWKWPVIKSRAQLEYDTWLYAHFYRPLCISQLKKYLKKEQKRVMAKVKPRVRVIKRYRREAGGVQMTCLATGFYPRHINLTLLQDGQPVNEERITRGALLPNPDGTYQMRKSVELSAEEQRERHTYTCSVTHLSLDNKLDISIEPGPEPVIIVPAVLLLLFVFGFLAVFKIWRKRYSQPEQIIYIPTSAADDQTAEQQM
ncbi:major histocompatibility complex class I-related gene protein isoform X1 [Carassius auratus]|uniref:Major histocompatibility complex class I-related gene protein isoform X1 n=2 Tax=Carassius auratus TaxID=7957 RepID=A0A6P6JU70_CARAU|nr:major histocompatibility complex class I-related gene protein-like isoform X1 [Carassius auratus]